MPFLPLEVESAAAWLAALPGEPPVLLYKHSTRCGVSLDAQDEVRAFAAGQPGLAIWQLEVPRQRRLADDLAERLGVPHQSPQVILLRGGAPVWHTSHQRITRDALAAQLAAERAG